LAESTVRHHWRDRVVVGDEETYEGMGKGKPALLKVAVADSNEQS